MFLDGGGEVREGGERISGKRVKSETKSLLCEGLVFFWFLFLSCKLLLASLRDCCLVAVQSECVCVLNSVLLSAPSLLAGCLWS